MAVKTFAVGEVLTASDTNTYLANSGLVYITSSTFSGSSFVQVNNCFSSTYDNYRVMISYTTAAGDMQMRLSVGGTPATGATDYTSGTVSISNAGGIASYGSSGGTNLYYWHFVNTPVTQYTSGVLDIYGPYLSAFTRWNNQSTTTFGTGYTGGGAHQLTTAYDGIRITNAGGSNIAGTITIMGYRKA